MNAFKFSILKRKRRDNENGTSASFLQRQKKTELSSGLLLMKLVRDVLAKFSGREDSVRSHSQGRTIPQELPHEMTLDSAATGKRWQSPRTARTLASSSEGSAGENETRVQERSVPAESPYYSFQIHGERSFAKLAYDIVARFSKNSRLRHGMEAAGAAKLGHKIAVTDISETPQQRNVHFENSFNDMPAAENAHDICPTVKSNGPSEIAVTVQTGDVVQPIFDHDLKSTNNSHRIARNQRIMDGDKYFYGAETSPFRLDEGTSQDIDAPDEHQISQACGIQRLCEQMQELRIQTALQNSDMKIDMERIKPKCSAGSGSLAETVSKRVLTTRDDFLGDRKIFQLKIGKPHKLLIDFESRLEVRIKISWVSIWDPVEKEEVSLDFEEITVYPTGLQVLALFDPTQFSNERLTSPSPWFGDIGRKYVSLTVRVGVQAVSTCSATVGMRGEIYCRMLGSAANIRLIPHRVLRCVRTVYSYLPQSARDAIRWGIKGVSFLSL